MEPFALQAIGIRKTYKLPTHTLEVLRGVNLSVISGSWVSLTGQSGCGKSTFLRILGALDEPDGGTVSCNGQQITTMNGTEKARLRRLKIGFIFQSYQLFTELNALENVMLPGQLEGLDLKTIRARAAGLLADLGVESRMHHRPAELSGGEQQRIAIARALMNRPKILLGDEPTGNLDDKNSIAIMEILQKLREEEKITIIMVTHDQRLTEFADRTYSLNDGLLIE